MDKKLFTPGPLTTSPTVKAAMLRDLGSRDHEFMQGIKHIRQQLLEIAEAGPTYEAVLMQGSGTFGIESVLSSVTPPDGKWLVIINGAYGQRIAHILETWHIPLHRLEFPENQHPPIAVIENILQTDSAITHVAVVHCETTTGIFNPIEDIGRVVKAHQKIYMVDAMSSFGAVPIRLADSDIDYLISSANKCIEGVPGFSFILARREALLATEGYARSVSLNLLAQWKGLEGNGQFRFTPPTHALLAFAQALEEHRAEGGVPGRAARYRQNYEILLAGMRELGFEEYLDPSLQGYIITSFRYPSHPNFDFEQFYRLLSDKGLVIYPGKLSHADCFRIGSIGRLYADDMRLLVSAIQTTLDEMGISLQKAL